MNEKSDLPIMIELFKELHYHVINDDTPSIYLSEVLKRPEFIKHPLDMILKLKDTEQSPIHHPEGNVWNHTLLVVDEAAKRKSKSKDIDVFMWAALLHDIGKPSTTEIRKGKITSYNHDTVGAKLSAEFLSFFTDDLSFISKVSTLIKYHMQILYVTNDLSFADIKGMKLHCDINEIALLGLCDRLGRTHSNTKTEENNIKLFIKKSSSYK